MDTQNKITVRTSKSKAEYSAITRLQVQVVGAGDLPLELFVLKVLPFDWSSGAASEVFAHVAYVDELESIPVVLKPGASGFRRSKTLCKDYATEELADEGVNTILSDLQALTRTYTELQHAESGCFQEVEITPDEIKTNEVCDVEGARELMDESTVRYTPESQPPAAPVTPVVTGGNTLNIEDMIGGAK